jgi:GNAT superfamily N-acetyltransferase
MPRESRADGYQVSDERDRIDVELVHRWLSTDSYWAAGRPLETVRTVIDGSMPIGVYAPDGRQVAFARAVTDGAVFAYIADVYVDRSCRGRGLGTWMVSVLRDRLRERGVKRFVLATRDAHGVYARLGFAEILPGRWMEAS